MKVNSPCCVGKYKCDACRRTNNQSVPAGMEWLFDERESDDADDGLDLPVLNWQEIRREEAEERRDRERAFNHSPRPVPQMVDNSDDLLIAPTIDWAAERRAERS